MSADLGRVRARLAFVEEQAAQMQAAFGRFSLEELGSPERALERGGIKYAVQTAAEAMADVAYHLCARLWRHAPRDPHDALDFLAGQGVLSRDALPAWHALMGLRNRLVHGYLDVSEERFLREARDGQADMARFVEAVRAWVEQSGAPPGG